MKNDSIVPLFVVSLVFGGFVYFEMNRKIEQLKNDVVNLQIHLSQRDTRNVQFSSPAQGLYYGR